ncbi:MAG: ATP-binding cassette domain-containing protein [Chromatiaceae bacterium]|nr:ATP-binding cassette domain-containing protein [Candidatus Thioaporhodococcus sediminis]
MPPLETPTELPTSAVPAAIPIPDAVIRVWDLSFAYGAVPVLEGVNLEVGGGEFLGIVGPNAGGKSTLLKLILGLLEPQAGRIRVLGQPPAAASRLIGYVPQYPSFPRDFPITVEQAVLLARIGGHARRHPGAAGHAGIADRLSVTTDSPSALPGGWRPHPGTPAPPPATPANEKGGGFHAQGTIAGHPRERIAGHFRDRGLRDPLPGWLAALRPGGYGRADRAAARQALEEVEAADLAQRRIGSLSGGQLQRVLLARALAGSPRILILDEPTANIDQRLEGDIFDLLRRLNARLTILVVSHDIGFISSYVGRVACVNRTLICHRTDAIDGQIIRDLYGESVRMVAHRH